jgi:ribonuclease I
VPRQRLIQAFETEFGAGAGRALEVTCRRIGGAAYLSEIRLALRRDALDMPLSREALHLDGPAPRGGCPADVLIDRAG